MGKKNFFQNAKRFNMQAEITNQIIDVYLLVSVTAENKLTSQLLTRLIESLHDSNCIIAIS